MAWPYEAPVDSAAGLSKLTTLSLLSHLLDPAGYFPLYSWVKLFSRFLFADYSPTWFGGA